MEWPRAISFEIRMLSNMIKRRLDEGTAEEGDYGLTGMQGWVIGYIRTNDGREIFQRDLEKAFNIRRASVTSVLKLMERNELIVREPVAYDARLKKITLTPKARNLHEMYVQRFMDFEKLLRQGLTEEELVAFFEISEKLKKIL